MTVFEGIFQVEEGRVAIVVLRFNEFITSKLLSGAEGNLIRHGLKVENIDAYWVPGAFEISFAV
ncbi:hypothetical protein A5875_003824 [Enterococcus sp. 3H8_DIV0648]|nr:hypothetical protein A5875_003824 [Enterococcus sp. 3H8_DIV0648]